MIPDAQQWKTIPGYDGCYQASTHGCIRNTRTRRVLTPYTKDEHGYLRVTLCAQGRKFRRSVHRLICETFYGPSPDDKPHVDHIDGVVRNNASGNLRWISNKDNQRKRHVGLGNPTHFGVNNRVTEEEHQTMLRMYRDGESTGAISVAVGRSRSCVRRHCTKGATDGD